MPGEGRTGGWYEGAGCATIGGNNGANTGACGLRGDCDGIDDVALLTSGVEGSSGEGGNVLLKVEGGGAEGTMNEARALFSLGAVGVEDGTSGDWPKTGG